MLGSRPVFAQMQGAWTTSGNMVQTRDSAAQALAGGKLLVAGGTDGITIFNSAELYDPATGKWTATGSMAQGRMEFAAVTLRTGRVLVVGGLIGSKVLTGAELYNPSTGRWSPAGHLLKARFDHTATLLLNGEVLVAGGCTAADCSAIAAQSELYNPVTNTWSTAGSMLTPRYLHSSTLLDDGGVLSVGGSNGRVLSSCELYDPSSKTWKSAASTAYPRFLHAATLLPDGNVLVTGGNPFRYALSAAEIYDFSTDKWTMTGSMIKGRFGHTSTLLTDGTVLVAGGGMFRGCGRTVCFFPSALAETYNETVGGFSATGAMNQARLYHRAVLLGNGRVLVEGGDSNPGMSNSSEFYVPLSLTFSSTALNFGLLQIGLTSASQTVTVTNVSGHSVTISSITHSGEFKENNTCPGTLYPGNKCTITTAFAPTSAGVQNGAVTLNDNCPGSPTQTIALTGTGERYAISLTPDSLIFPGQTPGTTSAPMYTTLTNDGAKPVHISSIKITSGSTIFSQTNNNCPATIDPNRTCNISVVFKPPDTGTWNGTLSVTDSARGSPHQVPLSGIGTDSPTRRRLGSTG